MAISRSIQLIGVATVVPLTSSKQSDPRFSVQFRSPIDESTGWAICNHVTTVAVSRLLPAKGSPNVSQEGYREIMQKVVDNLATD